MSSERTHGVSITKPNLGPRRPRTGCLSGKHSDRFVRDAGTEVDLRSLLLAAGEKRRVEGLLRNLQALSRLSGSLGGGGSSGLDCC